jgi:predicted transcriptional regulator
VTKQTTVRLPDDLAADAEAVARVRGDSVNQLIVDSLTAEIERVRADDDFTARAKRLIERDREILDRLAKRPDTSASLSSGFWRRVSLVLTPHP